MLDRHIEKKETEFGEVRYKKSEGYGVEKDKLEFEDVKKIALENDLSLEQVRARLR